MRASRWLVGSSGAALVPLAAIAVVAACSSTPAPAPEAQDASGVDADASCRVDASLTMFASSDAAGSDCAACVQANCLAAVDTCSVDCTCIGFFVCVADAGTVATGISQATQLAASNCVANSPGTLLNDPGLRALLQCFQGPCETVCSAPSEAGGGGEDASADDATVDASGSSDGGVGDANASDAAADAPADVQVTDAADAHADGG